MKECFATLMVLFLASIAVAAPEIASVSGSFANGDTLTINGSGFMTKDPAPPFFWDDFEGGTAGDLLRGPEESPGGAVEWLTGGTPGPVVGQYSQIGPYIQYTDSGVFSGSKSAYEYVTDHYNGFSARWSSDSGATNAKRAFASMCLKLYAADGTIIGDGGENFGAKMFRINTWDGFHQYGNPNVWWGTTISGGVYGFHPTHFSDQSHQVYHDSARIEGETLGDPNGEWFSFSLWGVINSRGGADGSVGGEWNGIQWSAENQVTLGYEDALDYEGYRNAYFFGYVDAKTTQEEYWIDEAYADTTLARVAANLDSAQGVSGMSGGQTAMQIPVYWSDALVRVVVNTGRYTENDTLQLRLWNEAGEVSDPFNVVVGATAASSTPDIQSATRSGGNAELTWLSGDGGPYMVWLQAGGQDVRALATTDTTATLPMNSAATDVTVKDGTSQRKTSIPE